MTIPSRCTCRCKPIVPVRALVEWADFPASIDPPSWLRLPAEPAPRAIRLPSAGQLLQERARRLAEMAEGRR
jgi:hypothetical protein